MARAGARVVPLATDATVARLPVNDGSSGDGSGAAWPPEQDDIVGDLSPGGRRPTRDRAAEPPRDVQRDNPSTAGAAPQDEPPTDVKAAVAYWRTKDPSLSPGDIAKKVGRSRSTVRRIVSELTNAEGANGGGHRVNGAASELADSVVSR
jgi:hypothetical protein